MFLVTVDNLEVSALHRIRIEEERVEADERKGVVVRYDLHILDIILLGYLFEDRAVRTDKAIGLEIHFQLYDILVERAIGQVSQVIAIESIIAVPPQEGRDALPLGIEDIAVEEVSLVNQRGMVIALCMEGGGQRRAFPCFQAGDAVDAGIRKVHLVMADAVRFVRADTVGYDSFLVVPRGIDFRLYLGIDISLINEETL